MDITLLAVGKLRPSFRAAADDYLRRLRRFTPVRERELKESGRAKTPLLERRAEGERILAAIPERALVIALTRLGRAWTSRELSLRFDEWRSAGRPVCLLIGGSSGLDDRALATAAVRWSLGPLTLPHELARVVVLEQLYRASTILRGEKYHKGGPG